MTGRAGTPPPVGLGVGCQRNGLSIIANNPRNSPSRSASMTSRGRGKQLLALRNGPLLPRIRLFCLHLANQVSWGRGCGNFHDDSVEKRRGQPLQENHTCDAMPLARPRESEHEGKVARPPSPAFAKLKGSGSG